MLQYGEGAAAVDLVGSTSVQGEAPSHHLALILMCLSTDVIERISAWIQVHPEVEKDRSHFILGLGWDQTKWEGGEFPSAVSHYLP